MATKEICVHGSSGHFQSKNVDGSFYGWGIDYNVTGTGSWLQYSIPLETNTTVTGIRLRFTIGDPQFGWLRHVHIYDDAHCVKKFDNLYLGKGGGKTQDKVLALQPPIQIIWQGCMAGRARWQSFPGHNLLHKIAVHPQIVQNR